MTISRQQVLDRLRVIDDPGRPGDIVDSGTVRALIVDGETVRFVLEAPEHRAADYDDVRKQAERAIEALGGKPSVSVVQAAQTAPLPPDPGTARPHKPGPQPIPGIANVIAVASGKGGVGKSTVAANLACALAAAGRRVALLDADVYGPSQPRMLGVSGRPSSPDGTTVLPMRNHGVTMMSIGLLAGDAEAVAWRGPMLMGALQQMLSLVQWGAQDVLLVDLPPGTGDVPMTLAQKTALSGAIVVSTPQDVALMDVRKGVDMFRKLDVPILGMVENMSTHVCTSCGHEEHVFGHGGAAEEARSLGVPLLAEIPLHLDIRAAGDSGAPIVVTRPDGPQAAAFASIARRLIDTGVA